MKSKLGGRDTYYVNGSRAVGGARAAAGKVLRRALPETAVRVTAQRQRSVVTRVMKVPPRAKLITSFGVPRLGPTGRHRRQVITSVATMPHDPSVSFAERSDRSESESLTVLAPSALVSHQSPGIAGIADSTFFSERETRVSLSLFRFFLFSRLINMHIHIQLCTHDAALSNSITHSSNTQFC